jgi:hypothetical protein
VARNPGDEFGINEQGTFMSQGDYTPGTMLMDLTDDGAKTAKVCKFSKKVEAVGMNQSAKQASEQACKQAIVHNTRFSFLFLARLPREAPRVIAKSQRSQSTKSSANH